MSETDSKITLKNEDESINRWDDDLNIPANKNYNVAVAVSGGWIIFNKENNDVKDSLILDPENNPIGKLDDGKVAITAVTTVSYVKNGICLCEEKKFFGKNYTYGSDSSILEQFPFGKKTVSSFTIFGDAQWKLYYEDAAGKFVHKVVTDKCEDVTTLGIASDKIVKVAKL